MKLISNLVKLFVGTPYEQSQATVPQTPVENVSKAVEPAISEPVISLGESLLIEEDWTEFETQNEFTEKLTLSHVSENLKLEFTRYNSQYAIYNGLNTPYCDADWMTKDEKKFINSKLRERYDLKAARENKIERDKFMVLVGTNKPEATASTN